MLTNQDVVDNAIEALRRELDVHLNCLQRVEIATIILRACDDFFAEREEDLRWELQQELEEEMRDKLDSELAKLLKAKADADKTK